MESLKNIIYAGVGLATMTSDKLKETINDLVERGKISDTEGKRIIDDFFKTTESTKEEFETKIKSMSDKLTSTFDFKGKKEERVIKNLEKKISELEKQLAEAKKSGVKTNVSKTAETKTTVAKKTASTKKTTAKTATTAKATK